MKTLTILVAEDDLLTRMTLERSVVQWGYQLVSAVDGESCARVAAHPHHRCLPAGLGPAQAERH